MKLRKIRPARHSTCNILRFISCVQELASNSGFNFRIGSGSNKPVPADGEAEDLLFLKECANSSWTTIEEKWVATAKVRTDTLRFSSAKGDDLLLGNYYNDYPCLKNRNGYQLVSSHSNFC